MFQAATEMARANNPVLKKVCMALLAKKIDGGKPPFSEIFSITDKNRFQIAEALSTNDFCSLAKIYILFSENSQDCLQCLKSTIDFFVESQSSSWRPKNLFCGLLLGIMETVVYFEERDQEHPSAYRMFFDEERTEYEKMVGELICKLIITRSEEPFHKTSESKSEEGKSFTGRFSRAIKQYAKSKNENDNSGEPRRMTLLSIMKRTKEYLEDMEKTSNNHYAWLPEFSLSVVNDIAFIMAREIKTTDFLKAIIDLTKK